MMSSVYITQEVVEMSDLSDLSDLDISQLSPVPDWRTLAISKLQRYGLQIVNPIDWAIPNIPSLDIEKRVRRALDLIDQCDVVLANLHRSSYGTAMEIFYAHRRGKMVTVIGNNPFSPWVVSHSQARFGELNPALDFLIEESLQTDILQWALQFESGLQEKYEDYPPSGEPDYQFFGGDNPTLVLAPHASTYFRDGQFLEPDFFTGAIASSLHRLARSHATISTYCAAADPCYYLETPYARGVAEVIKSGQVGFVLIVLGLPWHETAGIVLEPAGPDGSDIQDLCGRLRMRLSPFEQVVQREPEEDVRMLQNFIAQTMNVPSIVMRVHRRFRMPRLQPQAFLHLNTSVAEFLKEIGTEFRRGIA